jgi:hypothetical protein
MTHAPTHQCLLGAIGWDHDAWIGGFYPDDMPPEWRLAYYNTHFECVLLPYREWGARGVKELTAWREDTLERFRFLLEHPPGALTEDDRARIDALADKAVLLGPEQNECIIWFDATGKPRELAARVQAQGARGETFYLLSLDANQPKIDEVRTLMEVLGY